MSMARREFLKSGMAAAAAACSGLRSFAGEARMPGAQVRQIAIAQVERMPNVPAPFKVRDWRQVAIGLDAYAFDLKAKGPYLPLVWIDKSHVNFDEDTFGLYVTVDDPRCGPVENKGQFHDALCDMPAVIGATLVGIDKRNRGGHDWVAMCKAFTARRAARRSS